MIQQRNDGDTVALLWPGEMILTKGVKIKDDGEVNGIRSWEVLHSIPIPYDEGIQKFDVFMEEGDLGCYRAFLKQEKPDVIHVHTLMGLHKNFLVAAKDLGIKCVFSAHDFFPICPKVTLFRNGNICTSIENCEYCAVCNSTALSIWKMRFLQNRVYRKFKNVCIVKKLRQNHRNTYLAGQQEKMSSSILDINSEDYKRLRRYYKHLLEYMDIIHYNSSITRNMYEEYLKEYDSVIIPITHAHILDNRRIKNFAKDKLHISYLGPYGEAKGFFLLKEALDELWIERQDFCLDVYFKLKEKPPYINTHNRYTYDDLGEIFDNTDVVVVPSIGYETFGYTVLEAMSYSVPVVLTKNVGAKDVVTENAGLIIEDISIEGIKNILNNITKEDLKEMNSAILNDVNIMTLQEMSDQIKKLCYEM